MELDAIVAMIMNNGLAVVVVAYFLYRDNKYQATMLEAITTLKNTVDNLSDLVRGALTK